MNVVQAASYGNVGPAGAFGNVAAAGGVPPGGDVGGAGGDGAGGPGVRGMAGRGDGVGVMPGGYMTSTIGMQMMHPGSMNMIPQFYQPQAADDHPVYVNAKQFHRILKRREARKKKFGDDDVIAVRNRRKQYVHESRHRHAMNRKRGEGGRFLSRVEQDAKGAKQ